MKIRDIKDILNAKILIGNEYLDKEVKFCFSSDLMSDVLAYVDENTILITGLNNLQVIRTAEMIDLLAIVFVRGKIPNKDIIRIAKDDEIVILCTDYTMYVASGKLYEKGLKGLSISDRSNKYE